jgi:motility quorum-sensing regulator / GCU-specific mRNA interferase toxin
MEKDTPHCPLSDVHALIDAGLVRQTLTASTTAAVLGLDSAGMVSIVRALDITDFYKSMTTHRDHRVWQDVYRPVTHVGVVYLKLMVSDDVLIVSFKEL